MSSQLGLDQLVPFRVDTSPDANDLGRALEQNGRVPGAMLHLCFGDEVARLSIPDLWSACCELLLEAQLARESRLDRFVVDVEQIFSLSYDGDLLRCTFSREHVFAVDREEFASALEQLIEEVFAATSCPRLMQIAARWSASNIRAQPYSYRFSDSVLT